MKTDPTLAFLRRGISRAHVPPRPSKSMQKRFGTKSTRMLKALYALRRKGYSRVEGPRNAYRSAYLQGMLPQHIKTSSIKLTMSVHEAIDLLKR